MRNLARYANPAQLRGLGLGLGRPIQTEADLVTIPSSDGTLATVNELAERLLRLDVTYALEPFNPRSTIGQIVRTLPEVIEGRGTCLDFAISLAALCVQAGIPVTLAVAYTIDRPGAPRQTGRSPAHAFVIVQQEAPRDASQARTISARSVYLRRSFDDWIKAFRDDPSGSIHHLVDATPLISEGQIGTLEMHRQKTMDWLICNRDRGVILTVAVQDALKEVGFGRADAGYYQLPQLGRDLGITAWLPDLPQDRRDFPSRSRLFAEDPVGNFLIVGPKGSGKSTLALHYAQQARGGRGWFLDGSDRTMLLRSLGSAEAQCRGTRPKNDQKDHLVTLAARARNRLAQTSRPWVVVIDNTDGSPDELLDLLPTPATGQTLIVTTVNEEWLEAIDSHWKIERLDLLDPGDLDREERSLTFTRKRCCRDCSVSHATVTRTT
jgi:hypothetical protein